MTGTVEEEILVLRDRFRSDRDPSGRGFAPLADALRRAGRLDEAAAVVHEGVGELPDFSIGHLVAAWVHRDRGDLAGARGALREVLRLDPLNVVALRQLARLLDDGGDPAEADRLRERAAAVDGGTGEEVDAPLLVTAPTGSPVAPAEAHSPPEDLAPPPGASPLAVSDGEPTVGEGGGALPAADPDWFVEPWTDGEEESDQPAFPPDDVQTRTMAEVYASQGLLDRAVEVYSHLLEEDPENGELAVRLEELREQRRARRAQGHEGGVAAAPAVPEAAVPDAAVPGAGGGPGDEDEEGVLLHLPPGAGDVVESPFAWTQADEEEAEDAGKDTEADGPPLSAFFDEILSWSPTGAAVDAGVTAAETPEVQEAPEPEGGDRGAAQPDLLLESATEPELLEAVSEPEVLEAATEPEGLLSPAAEPEALPAPPSHPGLEAPGGAELLSEAMAAVGPEPLAEPEAEVPEEPVPALEPAPEPAPGAPRGPAGSPENPVSFESLAPEDGVPHWVPVAQLAPGGQPPRWVPIGELAPDPDPPRASAEPSSPGPRPVSPPPPDASDDEFRAWLERLRL